MISKNDLFEYKVKWKHLLKKNIFQTKVKKWLEKKSIAIFTVAELSFINMVLKLLEE